VKKVSEGEELIEEFNYWYVQGAEFPKLDSQNIFDPNTDFLTNALRNQGKRVLELLNSSRIKNRNKIIEAVMEIAKRPYKQLQHPIIGAQVDGYYNRALKLVKDEVL
jgi:hypothetical protein